MKRNFILSQFNNIITKRYFSTKIQAKMPIHIDRNSPVTRIRVWKSGYYFKPDAPEKTFIPTNVLKSLLAPRTKDAQANIGHVSIETKEIYASLWPKKLSYYNKYKPQPGLANHSSPSLDEEIEDRPPDYLVDLYTLDVENIKQKFNQHLEKGSTYHIIGSNRFFESLEANSCCGLAYDLLLSGGIKKLITSNNFIRDYVITTPNNLAQLVLEAQANEQAMTSFTKLSV